MDNELRILAGLKTKIEKGLINFKKSPKDKKMDIHYITTRIETLHENFTDFSTKHTQFLGQYGEEELVKFFQVEDVYEDIYEVYLVYKSLLKSSMSTLLPTKSANESFETSPDNMSKTQSLVRLPKIEIPVFGGEYAEWSSFRDLFTSLIHKNDTLDDVQRLHYLKTQLSGEAAQLIRHVPVTEANYQKCWTLLDKRYSNKRFIATSILQRLFGQRNMTIESSIALKQLLDVTNDCLHELENLGIDVKTWDILIIYVISSKLDMESRKQWELEINESTLDLPTWVNFSDFLEKRFRALEFVEPKGKFSRNSNNISSRTNVMHSFVDSTCPHCSEAHLLSNCKLFAEENSDKRRDIVRSLGACYNCLRNNHSVKMCRVVSRCRLCQRKHHTLLHVDSNVSNAVVVSNEDTAQENHAERNQEQVCDISSNIATHFVNGQVLLASALVRVKTNEGSVQILRALLDQGSQASFITESAAQLLRLKKMSSKTTIAGIGGQDIIISKYIVIIKLQSIHDPSYTLEISAHVLESLTAVMPSKKINVCDWPDIKKINLADPMFNVPNKIDILLGAEIYSRVLKPGLLKDSSGALIAQDTHLGWIISGHLESKASHKVYNNIIAMHVNIEENEMLKRLWEMDAEPSYRAKIFTPEEQACEEYFQSTTKRDTNGRYVVKLPFRMEDPPCIYGSSKTIAIKRLLSLERKLERDKDLKRQYAEVINEYLLLGHAEKVTDRAEKDKVEAVYLPHHAVVKQDRVTTKVRVVYDASCKGINGVSLNDTLMVGPTLQPELRHILMRWRQHPICLTADIVKMYRQIRVDTADTDFQRILWREDPSKDIEVYRLLTVTFGTSCAPYLAVKSLQQVAKDEGKLYPLVADRVLTDFYMDDLLTGCQSEVEAIQVYKELNEMLNKAGFELQKWTCNRTGLFEKVKEVTNKDLENKFDKAVKVLGLNWNRQTDEFDYSVKLSSTPTIITKRFVISEISRLYDPLGWASPCIITFKVFIQKLWIAGIEWDEQLPPDLLQEWKGYRAEIDKLVDFHIPRWIGKDNNCVAVELHGFADASNVAYAAVVYSRIIDSNGVVHTHLLAAKTKVAPIKQISIPRLELCGAVLTAKLLTEVSKILNIPKSDVHAWTDSTVVLAWLKDHPSRWKTYVANRTSEILSLLDTTQWAHVQSKDNPADLASRGVPPSVLLKGDSIWKYGPKWLRENTVEYSRPSVICTNQEKKVVKCHTVVLTEGFDQEFGMRYSSLRRLLRVIAFCRRFLLVYRRKSTHLDTAPYLSAKEIREALDTCIRLSQQQWFSTEINSLQSKVSIEKKSSLYRLNVFIDDQNLVRVGSRLSHSQLPAETKNPIVISHNSTLAKLIVADAHDQTFHGGQQVMLNFIRSRYWIIRVKSLVRTHIHKCVRCIRYSSVTKHQLMGDLPACRVTPSKPFSNSGVDFAGPISMRVSKGRGQRSFKGYICLFVCMATRAIHLEAVSDFTKEAFLAAFKRFVARRGHCSHIWSDNGTNFVGASKELRSMFNKEKTLFQDIAAALADSNTEWHFIPPHAPNFGGLWEAGIKSTKFHLKRVVGDTILTFEEMATVLCQIEACLNSRPLSQDNSDPDNIVLLTPGHFLVGQPLVSVPDYNYEDVTLSTLRRWQLVQRIVQSFWRRWKSEYLTQFFQRYKWAVKIPEMKVDDVVLIREDNLPPAKWLFGRIVELHPGRDGVTRVATVRCKNTLLKRPISKLCSI